MKKALLILTLLALAFSPVMVSQANAAPARHGMKARHHAKTLKKHSTKRLSRKHLRKTAL